MSTLSLTETQMRIAREARDPRFDGKFFVAVLSTGIFCRPICRARLPKEDNVRYHLSALSAMEAGFRPCKLCKPDSAPMSTEWLGRDATIIAIAKTIQQSPELNIADIAHRFHITERYIHKLFKQKLGIAPSAYKQSVQLLFAKQLLQQSRLPVTDVAFAAGFNSSRALQISMQKHFSISPSELRKNAKKGVTKPMTTIFLSYRPPYQWAPLRDFIASRCISGIESVSGECYQITVDCEGTSGHIKATHQPDKNGFSVDVDVADPRFIKPILDNLARVLDCQADWLAIEKGLSQSGIAVSDKVRGLRLPGVWTPFEAGCRAIFGQQVSVAAAINRTKLLVELIRENKAIIGFPSPADITEEIVEQIGMPAMRKQTLIAFAKAMAEPETANRVLSGDLDPLLSIKGIGPWTCQYIALRGLGDPDVWLEKDLAILRQCERYRIDAEAARPWRSYLTLALWQDYMEAEK